MQGPPVSEDMQVHHLFFIHEPGDPCTPDRGLFSKRAGMGPEPVHHVAAAAVDADDRIPRRANARPSRRKKGPCGP